MFGSQGNHTDERLLVGRSEIVRRLAGIKAVVCDWDGVFNDGFKDAEGGSPFSEVDSMGLNLLRFALWSRKEELPFAAIITGQYNTFAERFGQRERLHGIYMGFTNKPEAFDQFLEKHDLRPEEVLFMYDDVLDLPVAARCGLRVLIGHRATGLFQRTCVERGMADIRIHLGGGHHGLREACELLIDLLGRWSSTLDHRIAYDETYQRYLTTRQAVGPEIVRNPR